MPLSQRLLAIMGCLVLVTGSLLAQAAKDDKDKDAAPKTAAQGAAPEVGEITLDYAFKNLISGDGRVSMKELRGNVVLIDWWGFH